LCTVPALAKEVRHLSFFKVVCSNEHAVLLMGL
jgi:hypothetical protein